MTMIGHLRMGYRQVWLLGPLLACSAPAPESEAGTNDSPPPVVASAPVTREADERPVVLFIGTSLTAGLGLDPGQAYPALIQAKVDSADLPYRVVNAGVSGETSAGALRRIGWLLGQGPPAVVVVETGANDGLRGQSIDSLRANLEAILDAIDALEPRPTVFVAAMEALPNLGVEYGRAFRAIYPEVATRRGAILLPFLLDGVAGVDSLNQPDGIHPNPAGSRRVAENVWRVLAPSLRPDGVDR